MAQEYEQPVDSTTSPRTQRMTAEESRAVIDLWQSERVEQTGLTDRPAVPDVAEGLDITVEDVHRLLLEVRAKRLEEERALAAEQELSEIRLAEEERKLAEIQRQRAEIRREQAEAVRWRNDPQRVYEQQSVYTEYSPIDSSKYSSLTAVLMLAVALILIGLIALYAKP